MPWKNPKLGVVLAVLLFAGMWLYVQRVLVGHGRSYAAQHNLPRGNLSDLYSRWLGTRELLLHHRDPYSQEITTEIQQGYYGRPLDPNRKEDPKDQQAFAYPLYVVFLLAPTVNQPFPEVARAAQWAFTLLLVISVFVWIRLLRWRVSPTTFAILVIMTLCSYPAIQGLKLQQLSLLVSALIAGSAALLVSGQLAAAGVLLALASIKPQLTLPLVAWLFLWALCRWQERWSFMVGFSLTLASLLGGASYLLPGWMREFLAAAAAYRRYTGGKGSLLEVLLTPGWGKLAMFLLVLGTAYLGLRVRREPAASPAFFTVFSLVLVVTVVIVPMVAPYNQLVFLPAVFLVLKQWRNLWERTLWHRLALVLTAAALLWPSLSASVLALASFLLPAPIIQKTWPIPLFTNLFLPLTLVASVGLHACITLFSEKLRPAEP